MLIIQQARKYKGQIVNYVPGGKKGGGEVRMAEKWLLLVSALKC